jgi:para-nitrobenzyl esterase
MAKCLRALSVEQIMSLEGTPVAIGPYTNDGSGIVDGKVVVEQPAAAFASGRFNHVPLMNGLTHDENAFLLMASEYYTGRTLTADEHSSSVRDAYASPPFAEGAADKVLAEYPLKDYPNPSEANFALTTDPVHCGAALANQILAAQVPLYAYEFNDRTAPSYFPPMRFETGAYHTADIPFIFTGFHGGDLGRHVKLDALQERLSREMIKYWANFARSGNPNGSGDEPWPRYTQAAPVYLSQSLGGPATITETEYLAQHKCKFWSTVSARP